MSRPLQACLSNSLSNYKEWPWWSTSDPWASSIQRVKEAKWSSPTRDPLSSHQCQGSWWHLRSRSSGPLALNDPSRVPTKPTHIPGNLPARRSVKNWLRRWKIPENVLISFGSGRLVEPGLTWELQVESVSRAAAALAFRPRGWRQPIKWELAVGKSLRSHR